MTSQERRASSRAMEGEGGLCLRGDTQFGRNVSTIGGHHHSIDGRSSSTDLWGKKERTSANEFKLAS